jgi:hypothetical protein
MLRLLVALTLPGLLLSTGTASGQTGAAQAPTACEAKDRDTDATCPELKGLFTRKGDTLTINLDDAKSKKYVGNSAACQADNVEKCVVFRLKRYFPQTRSYLIDKGYYEGADYLLVSRRTGSETVVSDILALSPNAKFLVAIDQNDAGERAFDIALWSMSSDPPRQEFKYKAEQYENWEVIAWKDDTHISMKAWINGKTSYDQEAELVRNDKGWTLVLGKKTDRPQ